MMKPTTNEFGKDLRKEGDEKCDASAIAHSSNTSQAGITLKPRNPGSLRRTNETR